MAKHSIPDMPRLVLNVNMNEIEAAAKFGAVAIVCMAASPLRFSFSAETDPLLMRARRDFETSRANSCPKFTAVLIQKLEHRERGCDVNSDDTAFADRTCRFMPQRLLVSRFSRIEDHCEITLNPVPAGRSIAILEIENWKCLHPFEQARVVMDFAFEAEVSIVPRTYLARSERGESDQADQLGCSIDQASAPIFFLGLSTKIVRSLTVERLLELTVSVVERDEHPKGRGSSREPRRDPRPVFQKLVRAVKRRRQIHQAKQNKHRSRDEQERFGFHEPRIVLHPPLPERRAA